MWCHVLQLDNVYMCNHEAHPSEQSRFAMIPGVKTPQSEMKRAVDAYEAIMAGA